MPIYKTLLHGYANGVRYDLHPETDKGQIIGLSRQNSTAYAVGDIAFSAALPSNLLLVCTAAGTTAATEPSFSGATIGRTVTDGTAVWTYMPLGTLSREITPAFNHRDVVTTSGTYTAPVSGWYKITVKGGGGGGAGGGSADDYNGGGGGGGEGGTTIGFEYMTAGDTANVIIGAGGTGSVGIVDGVDGGNSSVTVNSNTYTGGGGYGGLRPVWATALGVSTNKGKGGAGTINGAAGTPPNRASMLMPGGNGGGNGASNATLLSVQLSGENGGGGAGGYCTASNVTGGNGGGGFVWFEYFAEV